MADDSQPAQQGSSLKLTLEQEVRMMNFVTTREKDICHEMGRSPRGWPMPGSWTDLRRLNQHWYEGNLDWRQGDMYYGGVFDESNFTRGDGKRYVRHLSAKITDDLLGTTPFFGAMKEEGAKNVDDKLIKAVEQYSQNGIDESGLPDVVREACEIALARNEAVVKLRYINATSGFYGPAEVLVDQTGQPVKTPQKQLYVLKNDDFIQMPDGTGVLEKDPSFIVPAQMIPQFQYAQFAELPQSATIKEGLEGRVIDYRDFLCPLRANTIHEADIVIHLYDEVKETLASMYAGFDSSQGYFNTTESGANSPIAYQGEQRGIINREVEWVHVGEAYLQYDADQDGHVEEILCVYDRDSGKAIFYDYLQNHLKKRPFEVIHGLRKEAGRWYGVGVFTDKFDQLIFIDKTFNKINCKTNKSTTVTAHRKEAIVEWKDNDGPIVLGSQQVYTIAQGWKTENGPIIEQIRLIEVTEDETNLMHDMIQASDQEFGAITAADASAAGFNDSKTATGVASLERSANNIVKATERVHVKCYTAILEQAVDILLENMDPVQVMTTDDDELLTLNRDEIRDLPRKVRLLLTRSRSSDALMVDQQATQIANEFFDLMGLDMMRAQKLRPLYINRLKALEVMDADDLLPEIDDDEVAQAQAAKSQQQPPQKPAESISIKYSDLRPSEQNQALSQLGITPGSEDEPPASAMAVKPAGPKLPVRPALKALPAPATA